MAEDPWILGFSKVENETLARLLQHGLADVDTAEQSEVKVDRVAALEQQLAAMAAMVEKITNAPAPKVDGRSKAARAARTTTPATAG
jgi:hypothetical protein